MNIYGKIMTGYYLGQILVMALLLIGIIFMGRTGFSLISIVFFIVFILPFSYLMHKRLVSRSKKLLEPWCDLSYTKPILLYKTGFPNTMKPGWQNITITEKNKDLLIIGDDIGGYQIQLSGENKPYPIRFGLWMSLDDVKTNAEKLSKLLNGKILEIRINQSKTVNSLKN